MLTTNPLADIVVNVALRDAHLVMQACLVIGHSATAVRLWQHHIYQHKILNKQNHEI